MAEKYFAEKKYINAQQLFESVIQFVKGTPRYEEIQRPQLDLFKNFN